MPEYQDMPASPSDYLPSLDLQPVCIGCDRTPEEIEDIVVLAKMDGMGASMWVRHEEGTYNPVNGHFACDDCYIRMGMPAGADGQGGPGRWVAP